MDSKDKGLTLSQKIVTDAVLRKNDDEKLEWLSRRYKKQGKIDQAFEIILSSISPTKDFSSLFEIINHVKDNKKRFDLIKSIDDKISETSDKFRYNAEGTETYCSALAKSVATFDTPEEVLSFLNLNTLNSEVIGSIINKMITFPLNKELISKISEISETLNIDAEKWDAYYQEEDWLDHAFDYVDVEKITSLFGDTEQFGVIYPLMVLNILPEKVRPCVMRDFNFIQTKSQFENEFEETMDDLNFDMEYKEIIRDMYHPILKFTLPNTISSNIVWRFKGGTFASEIMDPFLEPGVLDSLANANINLNLLFDGFANKEGKRFDLEELVSKFDSRKDAISTMLVYRYITHSFRNDIRKIDVDNAKEDVYQYIYNSISTGLEYIFYDRFMIMPEDFKMAHPDLFLSDKAPKELEAALAGLSYKLMDNLLEHPEWVDILARENINLNLIFKSQGYYKKNQNIELLAKQFDSRKDAINALSIYTYLYKNSTWRPSVIEETNFEDKNLKEEIYQKIHEGFLHNGCPYIESMPEDFKREHPDLFLGKDLPEELRTLIYEQHFNGDSLFNHPEWLDILANQKLDLNLLNNFIFNKNRMKVDSNEFVNKFENKKAGLFVLLNYEEMNNHYCKINPDETKPEVMVAFAFKYNLHSLLHNSEWVDILNEEKANLNLIFELKDEENKDIDIETIINQFNSKKDALKALIVYSNIKNRNSNTISHLENAKEEIYSKIYEGILQGAGYYEDMPEDFKKAHPDLFLSQDTPEDLKKIVCKKKYPAGLAQTLRTHPEWIDILATENINLNVLFQIHDEEYKQIDANALAERFESREDAIITFTTYFLIMNAAKNIDLSAPKESMYKNMYESILHGCTYSEDMPEDFKKEHSDLFLSEDAPKELKNYFYNSNGGYFMSFKKIQEHKDWFPFIMGKRLAISLLRDPTHNKNMMKYFEVFGEQKAIKLGISRAETIEQMVFSNQVDLMKAWYDKTGQKFIPDFVIMQNFKIEEADKFLTSGKIWSNLMKIKSFTQTPEAREAMLKLAYSFGAFDQDQRGIKKLQDLLVGLPKKIDLKQAHIFEQIATQIDYNGQTDLIESLRQENVDIDFSKNIFEQIYRKNEDGSYTLAINAQSCPKSAQAIRGVLEKFREVPMLTPDKAHHYLGGFKLEYDSDFRELFLSNFDIIIGDSKYLSQISAIQRRFKEIKTKYSNVNLTLDLAMSYINNNKYENVNTGNERVTQVAGLQNYSQQDFEILQQIYNYGKQRTFSSIPRISSDKSVNLPSGTYHYEILRLDDPRAMSIGFESDCCQRLGEPAEVCMEHSMVDKNGRVFIITNTAGEIVAQSWVWRNKDVLCFDNIEVPDQKMWDNGIPRGQEDSGIRNQFTDDILAIYKMVAHELIEVDEKVYKELLDSSKITQEQYEGLRLGKITAGLGYSNIKGSLKTLPIDKAILSRPLPFEEPVKLSRGLYTSDSTRQYVLEEREDRKEFDGETLPVHSDTYVEYSDSNFTEKSLLSLEKLEIVTKEDPRHLETVVSDHANPEHLVTEIAKNYELNPETTRIVMNPNFAIIYDVNDNKLEIGDLLFNTKIDNGEQQMDIENQVVMQIRLALEQIANNKEIDISNLDEKQKEMYAKVTGLTEEIDIERGVGHAR